MTRGPEGYGIYLVLVLGGFLGWSWRLGLRLLAALCRRLGWAAFAGWLWMRERDARLERERLL